MDTARIAALVKAGAPDHAGHTQELVELDAMDRVIKLMCSCSVGLTISLQGAASVAAPVHEAAKPKKGG